MIQHVYGTLLPMYFLSEIWTLILPLFSSTEKGNSQRKDWGSLPTLGTAAND